MNKKPVTLEIEDIKKNMIALINNSDLHISLLRQVIGEVGVLIDNEYKRVYIEELKAYNEDIEKEEDIDREV